MDTSTTVYELRCSWAKNDGSTVRSAMPKSCMTRNSACLPFKKSYRVSGWEATHCSSASALQTRVDCIEDKVGGDKAGYIPTISCRRAAIVAVECHRIGARSLNFSLFLLSSPSAASRVAGLIIFATDVSSELELPADGASPPGFAAAVAFASAYAIYVQ